ncbi:hypothetical protein BCR42DRAFT_350260 [Absidia repens]|uniref:RING-type E3 ubiquitin transferase n=1 Tax=Absidia repens TaxID=90262 RepID=A0A1X2IJV5_9FUNG|nr:hypothetical protein BCR42DRAFT_350260 [Absidia repens]
MIFFLLHRFLYCSILFGSIHATILVLSTNDTYMDRPALFGPTIAHETSLYGYIHSVAMIDRYGCAPIQTPLKDWIALVERGHCSFATKVRAMQQSHAKAVIVGDPHLNHWITMYALEDTSDIKIPSVYVAQYQFQALQLHALDQPSLIKLINDNEAAWSLTDMLMIILLSPCMMLLILYFGWKCHAYQCHLKNLAPCHVVTNLPSRRYRHEKSEEQDECVICLEAYLDDDDLRILPCRHEFHVHCIDPWLTTRKKVCPICKFNVCQNNPAPLSPRPNEHTPLLPI